MASANSSPPSTVGYIATLVLLSLFDPATVFAFFTGGRAFFTDGEMPRFCGVLDVEAAGLLVVLLGTACIRRLTDDEGPGTGDTVSGELLFVRVTGTGVEEVVLLLLTVERESEERLEDGPGIRDGGRFWVCRDEGRARGVGVTLRNSCAPTVDVHCSAVLAVEFRISASLGT